MDKTETTFHSLRAKALDLEAQWRANTAALVAQYGENATNYAAPRGKRDKNQKLRDRAWAAETKFYDFLKTISPRNWSTTVPAHWILHELSYADAITEGGALSVTPPVAYGSWPEDVRRFASPMSTAAYRTRFAS